jgi:2-dehydro-3-deoxygalactonokinase
MSNQFISCDWGTSNFRLRLVSLPELDVLAEESSDQGVGELAKAWRAKGEGTEDARFTFYMDVLKAQVKKLEERWDQALDNVEVVISGMASSTIGLVNMPYKHLPVPLDGSGLKTKLFKATADFKHDILLISGVETEDDVMRGEETQLIGCLTDDILDHDGEQMVVHPGTHSKHITIKNGQLTGFNTYMTGEFFKVLTTHGILRDNVLANTLGADSPGFAKGVQDSLKAPLLHSTFKVRTNDLFGHLSKEDNYNYLSGLLIGTELQSLQNIHIPVFLCCGPTLVKQYSAALEVLGLTHGIHIFPSEWEEGSVVRGQGKVLNHLSNKKDEQEV